MLLALLKKYGNGASAFIWFITIHNEACTIWCSAHMARKEASVQYWLNSRQWYQADNSCRQGIWCWRYFGGSLSRHTHTQTNRPQDRQLWGVWSHPHQPIYNWSRWIWVVCEDHKVGMKMESYWLSINDLRAKSSSLTTVMEHLSDISQWIVCDKV